MYRNLLLPVIFCVLFSCSGNKMSDTETHNMDSSMSSTYKPLEWVHQANIYEVNLRQYTPEGTFKAFQKELPRLKEMGVKVLWFMPITPIAQKNKKGSLGSYYAAADYTSINPEFGTLDDFKELVNAAHQQGFKVIIDWVANHTGWDHVWTKTNPAYYEMDSTTNDFKIASGMDDIIELNFNNPDLVKAMIDAMKFWVTECDIDGFRCDLAFWVELDFWKKARKEVDAVKPVFWFAENDAWEHPEYMQVFDASYTWKWMHAAKDYYQQQLPFDSLVSILDFYDQAPGIKSWFTTNHDENSWNGTEYEKYGDMALPLAVFSSTYNGIPLVYSGQELPNKKRLEFFEKDPIQWTGKNELHNFYKTLFNLRSNNKALAAGTASKTTRFATEPGSRLLAFKRTNGVKEVFVVLNFGNVNEKIKTADKGLTGNYTNVFTKGQQDLTGAELNIPAWGYLVFEK